MKFSLWTNHGARNSKPVFDAFRTGAIQLGHSCADNDPNSDVDVIWSVLWDNKMLRNKPIWENNQKKSKPTIVLEVGGIKRNNTWKVGLNGINRDAYFGPLGNNDLRAKKIGLKTKPWTKDGEFILICGQHDKSLQWQGMPKMSNWVMKTIDTVQKHTDRPILFRPHPRCRLEEIEHQYRNVYRQNPQQLPGTYDDFDIRFNNVYATVSYSSNPGIHSILNGVPAFVGPGSLAYDVANDIDFLHDIENPIMPDRTQWLNDYAWTEFSIKEIAAGIPLKRLTSAIQSVIV